MRFILAIAVYVICSASVALADIRIDVVPFTALTSASNQNITGNMGGLAPKGALVILSGGVTSGTIATHARLSFGAYDGTSMFFIAGQGEDIQSITDTDNWQGITGVGAIINIDRTVMCKLVPTMIANGVNLSQSSGCDQAYRGAVVLFGGSDTNFKIGRFNAPNSIGNSTSIATVGFEPDLVFLAKTKKIAFDDSGDPSFSQNIGISVNLPTGADPKAGISFASQNNLSTSASAVRVQNDSLWTLDVLNSDGQIIVEGYNANGFTARNQDVALGDEFSYAAISVNDIGLYLNVINTPSGANAGPTGFNGPVFRPQLSMFVMSGTNVVNSNEDTATATVDAGIMGIALYDGTDVFSASVSTQDGFGSPLMKSLASTTDIRMLQNAGTLGWQGAISHTVSGASIDFITNPSTARKWLYLAVQESFVFSRPRATPLVIGGP